jgi:alkyl sulfatase BDS1-like metallo-beta-lactamase superfamily hydrolase
VQTDTASRNADGDTISRFFSGLAETGHLATFDRQSATLRFDILDGDKLERWHVTVRDGDVAVTRQASRAGARADATVRIGRPHLAAMVAGRLNAMAAFLRGLMTLEGSAAAAMTFQRCLPGPPGSTGRVAPIDGKAVMAVPRGRPA